MKLKFLLALSLMIIFISFNGYTQSKKNNYKTQITSSIEDSIYLLDMGRFKLPLKYDGVIADVTIGNSSGGEYDNKVVLFSGGFMISGKIANSLWGAANASASRIQDFLPGKIGETINNPDNKFYYAKATDPFFGIAWQNWKKAVERGASFYDGNKDGIYEPIDLNNNGVWDANEDKPDILGRTSVFTKFNDGVDASKRRYNDMNPKGVEIGQMVSGYTLGSGINSDLVFVKYTLNNTGTVAAIIDSVIFSPWMDPDIGDANDDLAATDLFFNTAYVYNDLDDPNYGTEPAAIGIKLLQGPIVFIPGVTFTDNNNNGIYDEGIDVSLKTALKQISVDRLDTIKGAMNQNLLATNHYVQSDPLHGDPNNISEQRNYQKGLARLGYKLNPCSWTYGTVLGGVDCQSINPLFIYSGDPVTKSGWLNNWPTDQRVISSVGPFRLEANKPVDIIIAYAVARGSSALNSVVLLRNAFQQAKRIYEQKYPQTVGVNDEVLSPANFELEQNYPNPFNPETKIRFSLNKTESVKLSVFNVLGQEIKILVNEEISSGVHEVSFNGSELTSGIYFYQLKAGDKSEIRKMMLVK